MSLVVTPFVRTESGDLRPLEASAVRPRDDRAGLEASRHDLWGSEIVRALGCVILPSLAEGELTVEGTVLDELENELRRILGELRRVAAATEYREDFVSLRARNILAAIEEARQAGGGVRIAVE